MPSVDAKVGVHIMPCLHALTKQQLITRREHVLSNTAEHIGEFKFGDDSWADAMGGYKVLVQATYTMGLLWFI